MKRRVCILRSNPIRPDSRVEKEAACLVEAGYEVVILSWDRDDNHDEKNGFIDAFGYEVPIVWFGYKAKFGAGMKSIKPFSCFQKSLFTWLRRHRREYDIIHACDFDTAFTANLIHRLYHKTMVFDVFDYICGEPKSMLQRVIRCVQNRLIDSADATIICTEERKLQIKDSNPRKLAVVHNTPPRISVSSYKPACDNDRIKVCYVGILQDFRLLQEIPEFFINNPDFEFHVGGFGKYEKYYESLASQHDNIFFYGRLSYDKTLSLENSCDIMLAIYDPAIENHRFAAPNKFYESLMLAKPVIMVKNTGMSQIVAQYGIGETIDYNIKSFSDAVKRLSSRQDEWPDIRKKMETLYNEKYNWDIMKERLIELYASI